MQETFAKVADNSFRFFWNVELEADQQEAGIGGIGLGKGLSRREKNFHKLHYPKRM